ncbi:MOSC domain-containing protein [Flavilitoribacter nigricans]|uniref:MOSC domain-containing protein n=1 Tax=Flavilitoribacter nigricans (strain ATCC 23147 / DSM 23189 / NBRC 102662 / NCIMB 1420 / SS-2) TaxID=1122177 RepID=A0A2D0NGJ7_FLAN2|nr:MOSC N-terminal beta barrel domain-containing protein [Flavilitoribacter nigricans]PHN07538.1 MOSC domain-containing protein [Flavilitoribacter nigricans DSM 23189 = NBRC 102662]
MADLQLSQIYIYPVKSLRGLSLSETKLTNRGPEWDRRWMLVTPDGQFLSQRELGVMARLQPTINGHQIRVTDLRGGREDLQFPVQPPAKSHRQKVTVWQDECEALRVSPEADRWFSEALGTPCHLVYMPDDSYRPLDPRYAKGDETVSFADGYPYLILGEASMQDLNNRLSEPIDVLRFRPNLVFSGGTPFVEDNWKNFSIGSALFRGTKPCARCQIPTIDLHTGQASREPTRTLATFRRQDRKILFGLNACWELDQPEHESMIRIGDPIKLHETPTDPPLNGV